MFSGCFLLIAERRKEGQVQFVWVGVPFGWVVFWGVGVVPEQQNGAIQTVFFGVLTCPVTSLVRGRRSVPENTHTHICFQQFLLPSALVDPDHPLSTVL